MLDVKEIWESCPECDSVDISSSPSNSNLVNMRCRECGARWSEIITDDFDLDL